MLDVKEERKYSQLRKLGQQLHIPIPEAFWELEVRDQDGKVIQRYKQRSHSWVRNAYNLMMSQLGALDGDDASFGAGYINLKKTDGSVVTASKPLTMGARTASVQGAGAGYRGTAASDSCGILVGSGTDAESFEDYVLQTPIAEGAGAGQLNHVEGEAPAESYVGTAKRAAIARYLNNNSGGNVSVNEVGLVGFASADGSGANFMFARDKLASTVTVPDTGQLKVTYTVQLTYPE